MEFLEGHLIDSSYSYVNILDCISYIYRAQRLPDTPDTNLLDPLFTPTADVRLLSNPVDVNGIC